VVAAATHAAATVTTPKPRLTNRALSGETVGEQWRWRMRFI